MIEGVTLNQFSAARARAGNLGRLPHHPLIQHPLSQDGGSRLYDIACGALVGQSFAGKQRAVQLPVHFGHEPRDLARQPKRAAYMHRTALDYCKKFFDVYARSGDRVSIVDVGSQDVNGSLRSVAPTECHYIGLDFSPGKGVDIVLSDAYSFPLESNSADIVVSSSCFEHSQFFWLTFLEAMRVLKPTGLMYLNAPSNGSYHRYPTDNWRFYPDAGLALAAWAQRNGTDCILLESFIGSQSGSPWNDFVAIFLKDRGWAHRYPLRIYEEIQNATNIHAYGHDGPLRYTKAPQDVRKWRYMVAGTKQLLDGLDKL